ncbi:MAG: thioredoxin family protein [Acidobacteriota bacterium]
MLHRRSSLPICLAALLLALSFTSMATAAPTTGPAGFLDDLDAAVAQAKEQDAPILLSLYATWCGWCRKLDNEVFPSEAFRAFAGEQKFVMVRLDTEDGASGSAMKERYETSGVPNTLVLDPNMVKIAHVNGYAPPTQMVAHIGNQLDAWTTIVHHFPKVLEGDDVALQQQMARDLYQRGDGDRASQLFERLLTGVEKGTDGQAWLTYLAADAHRLAGRYDRAGTLVAESRKMLGRLANPEALPALREQVDLLSFYIAQDQGNCPQAVDSLETFLSAHPKSTMRPALERALDRLKQDAACA